jgi:hypothetical protein
MNKLPLLSEKEIRKQATVFYFERSQKGLFYYVEYHYGHSVSISKLRGQKSEALDLWDVMVSLKHENRRYKFHADKLMTNKEVVQFCQMIRTGKIGNAFAMRKERF